MLEDIFTTNGQEKYESPAPHLQTSISPSNLQIGKQTERGNHFSEQCGSTQTVHPKDKR